MNKICHHHPHKDDKLIIFRSTMSYQEVGLPAITWSCIWDFPTRLGMRGQG